VSKLPIRQRDAPVHGDELRGDVEKKLAAIRAAVQHEFPTSDVDTMIAEIERGYSVGQPDSD